MIQGFQRYLDFEIRTNESKVMQLNVLQTLTCWWRKRVQILGTKIVEFVIGTVLKRCAKFHNFLPER